MGVSHIKTSPIADGTNTDLIRPSDWNSAHTYNISHSELGGSSAHHIDVTISGNTSGALAGISSGTLTLAGGNNITISQAGNALTISGANVGGAQTGISGIANSETTYSSGTVKLSELGAVTVRSTTGQQFQISVNAQTNQTGGIYITAQSTGQSSSSTYDLRTLSVLGDGIISVGWSNSTLRISAPSQTALTATTVQSISSANAVGANNSRFALEAHAHEGVRQLGISTQGNTSGTTGFFPASQAQFVGSGMVTARQSTGAAGNVTITFNATQTDQSAIKGFGASNTGNTAGNTGISTGIDWVLAGSNNITISESTAGGGPNTLWVSGAAAGGAQTAISGLGNSETTYTSGTVVLSVVAGNLTIRSTTGQAFQFSASQTVQTQGITGDQLSIGVSTGGNTAGNTTVNSGSRFVFSGQANVTLSEATAAGATTLGISGNAAQTVQTQGVLSAGLSTGGNTQGNTTVNTGSRLVFVGTNNITLSQATAAGATTISISGGAGGAGGTFSGGISTNGNTSGNTGFATDRLALIGGNNVTLSGSTNAGSMSLTISVPNTASQSTQTDGIILAGVSSMGNTQGNTQVSSGTRLVFVGTNNITLSQATAANATTISISGGAGGGAAAVTLPGLQPYDDFVQVVGQYGNGTLVFDPQPLPNFQFDRFVQIIQNTNSSNSSGSHTLRFSLGLYTRNASSLSLLTSWAGSTALTHSGTAGSYSLYSGQRVLALTVPSAETVTEGRYWIGYVSSTASAGANGTYSQNMVSNLNSAVTGMFGSAANATAQAKLGQGVYSASSTALPNSVAFSQIQGTGSLFKRFPVIGFGSGTA